MSRADLIAAITKALKAADADLTDARAAAIAGRIADGKGPRGERRGGPPLGGPAARRTGAAHRALRRG